jgi:uncharacterized protein YegP (UPF0339 family)
MRVEVFKGAGVQPWYVRLVADNHKNLNVSEGYLTKWNAQRAARKMFPELEPRVVQSAKR